jgi:hypothetical protein
MLNVAFFIVILSVVTLSVVIWSVVMQNVVMLSVVAPKSGSVIRILIYDCCCPAQKARTLVTSNNFKILI